MPRALLPCLLLLAQGCGSPGATVRILDRVGDDGAISYRDVTLTHLTDLDTLTGATVRLYGGARVTLSGDAVPLDQGASRRDIVSGAEAVALRYLVDGGVVVPADFDALAMLSAYAHLERAADFFATLGVAATSRALPAYYAPLIDAAPEVGFPETDNAAFLPEADAFVILPMQILEEIPFSMNPGVLAHEYSHRALFFELWGGELYSTLERFATTPGSLNAFHRLHATDEGVADFFGAALSGDPDFLAHSVPDGLAVPRSLRGVHLLDPAWVGGLEPLTDEGEYARYTVGSVVAAGLWAMAEAVGVELVAPAVIAAEREVGEQVRAQFRYAFGDLESAVVANLPAASRPAACARLATPYAAVWSNLAGVCP